MKVTIMPVLFSAISIACVMTASTTFSTAFASAKASTGSIYFKSPLSATGNGCPSPTMMNHKISRDGSRLTMTFQNYEAKPGTLSCNISIPIHVGRGTQVSSIDVDFQGFVKGTAELNRSYFFSRQNGTTVEKGPLVSKKVSPLVSKKAREYTQRDTLEASKKQWSRCGADLILDLKTRITTKNRGSVVSLDATNLRNGIVFHLKHQKCKQN